MNLDYTKIPVTQFLANKFINFLPASEEQEIRMGAERLQLLDAWDLYIGKHSDKNGRIKGANNLTRAEALGRKEISEGVKNRNWMLYGTDKSGRLVLDTRDNFLRAMEPHYSGDQEVTYQAILNSEPLLNNHSKAWCKILNFGANAGTDQSQRIKEAMTVKHSNVANMKGLRKDHKLTPDPVKGPPLRAVVDGKVGPNAPLANLMARVLRPVRFGMHSNVKTEILSTEEALHLIQKFNLQTKNQRKQPRRGCKYQICKLMMSL